MHERDQFRTTCLLFLVHAPGQGDHAQGNQRELENEARHHTVAPGSASTPGFQKSMISSVEKRNTTSSASFSGTPIFWAMIWSVSVPLIAVAKRASTSFSFS